MSNHLPVSRTLSQPLPGSLRYKRTTIATYNLLLRSNRIHYRRDAMRAATIAFVEISKISIARCFEEFITLPLALRANQPQHPDFRDL